MKLYNNELRCRISDEEYHHNLTYCFYCLYMDSRHLEEGGCHNIKSLFRRLRPLRHMKTRESR